MGNKNDSNKKLKILKASLYSLASLFLIVFTCLLIFYSLLVDKNRCGLNESNLTNEEIINNSLVEGLSSMDSTFNFELSNEDVNQMLKNSLKNNKVNEHVESIYLESHDNIFNWCFDLNIPLITTRVVINTYFEENAYIISSINIGKLNAWSFLTKKDYLNNEIIDDIFSNASLPIYSHLENGYFEYKPIEFINKFELGKITTEFFSMFNDVTSISKTNIGFSKNLEDIKDNTLSFEKEEFDLPLNLKNKLTSEYLSDWYKNETRNILEVSDIEFTNYADYAFNNIHLTEILTNNDETKNIECNYEYGFINFSNNQFIINYIVSINDFRFKIASVLSVESLGVTTFGFNLYLNKDGKSPLASYLDENFAMSFSEHYMPYVIGSFESKIFFNFSYIQTTCDGAFELLDFETSCNIENNMLIFRLTYL